MDLLQQAQGQLSEFLAEFQAQCSFKPGNLIVFGASSSEIRGQKIGTASAMDVAGALFPLMQDWARKHGLYLAVQSCEHINRSLVVEEECMDVYGLEEVCVVPHVKAGGAFATCAFQSIPGAVMVESLLHQANGGIDIGGTLIGMHLRRVAVPVRTATQTIGKALISCAKTRPVLVGGERAHYC